MNQPASTVPSVHRQRYACFVASMALFGCLFLIPNALVAQPFLLTQADSSGSSIKATEKLSRMWVIGAVHLAGYGGSIVLLNGTWYKDYPRSSFHVFNDSKEWLQMDKLGHAWTVYNAGKTSAAMWRWAGYTEKKAALIGAVGSTAYMTAIEFLDGHSSKWGWSWSDIAANVAGTGMYLGQTLAWNEERISFKFSFHGQSYESPQLRDRANDLFGSSWYERMLKDYNAQTYWISCNLSSFLKNKAGFPAWLNLAAGYGADGMLGGFENKWTDNQGNPVLRTDVPRKRQFYLSPDIDFTRIRTNKWWAKTLFQFLNAFKCPAPALMVDSKGNWKAYLLYF